MRRATAASRASLFDGLSEPDASAGHCFAASDLLPAGDPADEGPVVRALADPAAAFYLLQDDRVVTRPGAAGRELLFAPTEATALGADISDAVLLGHGERGPRLAASIPDSGPERANVVLVDLRSLALEGSVGASHLGALAKARGLVAWRARHVYCGQCAGRMIGAPAGRRRHCHRCGVQVFPRTDPVVIMLVIRGEFCLLGRQRHFPTGRYTCLAGFVEPGEAIEAAVRREVREESGIVVRRVRYHSSQPWPFPHSLMIGCYGEAGSSRIAREPATVFEFCVVTRDSA